MWLVQKDLLTHHEEITKLCEALLRQDGMRPSRAGYRLRHRRLPPPIHHGDLLLLRQHHDLFSVLHEGTWGRQPTESDAIRLCHCSVDLGNDTRGCYATLRVPHRVYWTESIHDPGGFHIQVMLYLPSLLRESLVCCRRDGLIICCNLIVPS